MRAVVLRAIKTPLRIEELQVAEPGPGEVAVRIMAAGVCHSDYHFMNGDLPIGLPCVLGHEGAGVVEAIGEGVKAVAPGDHVVHLFRASCGRCHFCQKGRPALCWMATQLRVTGTLLDGSSRFQSATGEEIKHFLGVSCFAEKTIVPEQGLVKIRPEVPFRIAALMGCSVMTGIGAVMNTARVEAGASVLVIGAGGVGLNCVIGARMLGAHPVIVADQLDSKLEMAASFGATHGINSSKEDLVDAVRRITGGEGVDYAFEAVGIPRLMSAAFAAARRGGTITCVGIARTGSEVAIGASELVYAEKTLQGSYYGTSRPHADMPRLLDLYLAGQLPLDRLLSRSYALEEVNEAYRALLDGEVARSVLLPNG